MFPYLVFPVAFALLSYAYFYRALDDIVKLTKKDQTEGGEGHVTGHIIIFLIVAIVLLLIGVPVAATLGLSSILIFCIGRHSGHDRCSAPVLRMRCGSTDVYSTFLFWQEI